MPLGEFEQLLLFAILRLEDAAFGNAIRKELEQRTGRAVSPGAVYTSLDRLEAKRFVSSAVTESTPARGGRRMRLYRLQPAGAAALQEAYAMVRRMAHGLGPKLDALAAEASGGRGRRP
jgi:DNA-binding PadR family transcriptional regulator